MAPKQALHWDEANIEQNDAESLQANRMKITEPKTPFHYLEENDEPAAYPPKAAAAIASGEHVHDLSKLADLSKLTEDALARRQEQPEDDEAELDRKFQEHRSDHYKLKGGSLADLRKLAQQAMEEEDDDDEEEGK